MSRLNMSLSNQERKEILSKWFDKVVGLMLPGINCIRRQEKQKQDAANGYVLTREFHDSYSSIDITWPGKIRKVRFFARVVCMRVEEYVRSSKQLHPKSRREDPSKSYMPISVDNIKIGYINLDWIKLAKVKVIWLALRILIIFIKSISPFNG